MKRDETLLGILSRVLWRQRLLTVGLLLAVAGSVTLALVPPLVLEQVVDRLTNGEAVSFALALLYFLTLALSGILDAGKETLITVLGQKLTRGLRHAMCAKLSRLPASWFSKQDPGAIASRFVGDVDTVEALFASGVVSMAADVCKIVGILAVIWVKSRGLGILMLLVTPLLFIMTRVFQKRMLRAQLEHRAAVAKASQQVPETIRSIRTVHTLGKERYMARRYDDAIQAGYWAMERTNFYQALYSPIIVTVSAVMVALVMTLSAMGGGLREFFGMSVGTAVAIIAYISKVFEPLESIGMEIQSIQSAVAGVRRIQAFLAEPDQPPADERVTMEALLSSGKPAVELKDVSFSYDGQHPVVSGCDLTVETGETVTLTGRTGAGKTTLFRLVLGLYPPGDGSVQIFGTAAADLPPAVRRQLFGYVEQSFRLVPGTVGDQITLWDEAISREQMEKAAKMVGLHETILALDRGYDTPCTEGLFSQGQLQLLAIARAVAADPAILLLDEITASLDTATEARVLEALRRAAAHRTVLSISHRLYRETGGRQFSLT